MNKTLNYTIKRVQQLPQSAPSAALLMDTGIQPIESAIHKKQMMYYWKLKNEQDTVLANRVLCTQDDYYGYATNWDSKIQETLQLYALQTNDITTISRGAWRNRVNQVVNRRSNTTIQKKCLDGTKTRVLGETKHKYPERNTSPSFLRRQHYHIPDQVWNGTTEGPHHERKHPTMQIM